MGDTQTVQMDANETGAEAPVEEVKEEQQERPTWLPQKFKSPED